MARTLAPTLGQPVLYVVRAETLDDELRARVAADRASHPPEWITLEVPLNVGALLPSSP